MFNRQPKEIVKIEKELVYVPVTIPDYMPKSERWKKVSYLETVVNFCSNQVFRVELFDALNGLRMKADNCTSNEELKGINEGIRVLNTLISLPFKAGVEIENIKAVAATNNHA